MKKPFPILVDIDEVCVSWLPGFTTYLATKKIIPVEAAHTQYDLRSIYPGVTEEKMLNEIECFAHTTAYRMLDLIEGAHDGVHALAECFPLNAIVGVSCCGIDHLTLKAREYQLRHFKFTSFIPLKITDSKDHIYSQFAPGVVIDDNPKHISDAVANGHRGLLFDQPWNRNTDTDHPWISRVHSWEEIVHVLT